MKPRHGWFRCGFLIAALGWIAGIQPAMAQFALLHTFTGGQVLDSGVYDGAIPYGSLILSADGSTLYGMASGGGNDYSDGTEFKMNLDGSGFAYDYFLRNGGSGATPYGSLTLSADGSMVYGLTSEGGYWLGTAFWSDISSFIIPTNRSTGGGGGVGVGGDKNGILHCFEWSGSGDGNTPYGSLTLVGSTLYGMTSAGGSSGDGTLFEVNTDGSAYNILHEFAGGSSDGATPYGSLTMVGSEFYGMTFAGGNNGAGTLFKININGAGFTILHSFGSGSTDGTDPRGSLTPSGSTLYGMTTYGGSSGNGTLFKISTSGTGYTILHNFAGGSGDGQYPHGDLTLSADGSTLYGMTSAGGSSGLGVAFKIKTSGSGYTILHSFNGGSGDGATPYGSLTLGDSTLYGMTSAGGSNNYGVVFALPITASTFVTPAMTSPAPGSTLASSSVTFQWSGGTAVTNYFLYVGTSLGANNLYGRSAGLNLSATVSGLPVNGSSLYVRLWWATAAAGWQYTDYSYTAFHQTTTTHYTVAVSASPAVGGTVSGGGTYVAGASCTVTAAAKSGYTFTNWTQSGTVVSTVSNYNFTVNKTCSLVANFVGSGSSPLSGTWKGTWAWAGPGSNGCEDTDGGSFSMVLKQTGSSFSGNTSGAGIQSRNNSTCALVSTTSASGKASGTTAGNNVTLSFNLGVLNFTGTALLNNNTLTASFVRTTGGIGYFSITRQ